jgi:hypothetical protein
MANIQITKENWCVPEVVSELKASRITELEIGKDTEKN